MRNLIATFLVLTFFFCSASPGFAQLRKDIEILNGKLVSMDVSKNEVTIEVNGEQRTFFVKKGVNPSLQIGNEVVVMYKIGTNTATWVKLPRGKR